MVVATFSLSSPLTARVESVALKGPEVDLTAWSAVSRCRDLPLYPGYRGGRPRARRPGVARLPGRVHAAGGPEARVHGGRLGEGAGLGARHLLLRGIGPAIVLWIPLESSGRCVAVSGAARLAGRRARRAPGLPPAVLVAGPARLAPPPLRPSAPPPLWPPGVPSSAHSGRAWRALARRPGPSSPLTVYSPACSADFQWSHNDNLGAVEAAGRRFGASFASDHNQMRRPRPKTGSSGAWGCRTRGRHARTPARRLHACTPAPLQATKSALPRGSGACASWAARRRSRRSRPRWPPRDGRAGRSVSGWRR